MSAWRTTSKGASWVGRISFTGGVFVAGMSVAKAGTAVVDVVVDDEVVPFETVSFRPLAEVSCVGAESLGRLRGREEPSMKGVPNLPDREAGLLANTERSSTTSWVSKSWSSSWCGTSLGCPLSFGVTDKESWESLSENSFRMALTPALTRSAKKRLRFPFEEA